MPQHPPPRPQHVAPVALTALVDLLDAHPSAESPLSRGGEVTGITHDSRQVRPGDLYAALPGALTHGARFAAAAVSAGAVAVLTDDDGAGLAGAELGVPVLVVPDPRARLGEVAATIYAHPARDLLMFGVTGTNGKTTTAYLLEAGLRAAGHTTGLIGTVETRVGDEQIPSVRTTPESTDVHALLAVMRERGVTACAMEVSSHALVFGRVDGVVFDVAGFTNLTQDHLDFHAGLEDYFAAKASLFTPARARQAAVCVDDEFGRRLASKVSTDTAIPVTTVSGDPGSVPAASADWAVVGSTLVPGGTTQARLRHGTATIELPVPLPGAYNVTNAALAVAMLVSAGVGAEVAARGVGTCAGVPGRMERVGETAGDPAGESAGAADTPLALVDYAHTPDAIENVLGALREPGRGRLVVVVGAGGDRDPHKRPMMGAAAARGADVVVVTDDNPRSEDAAGIRAAVLAGAAEVSAGERGEIREVADRRAAIRAALDAAASSADTVAVLGKGHEQGQEIAGVVHPFDDRDVLREELRRWSERRHEREIAQ